MNPTVGSIQYDASIKLDQLKRDSKQAEAIARGTGDNIGDGVEKGTGRASVALGRIVKFAKVAGIAIGAAFTAAVGKFVIGGGISRALNIEDAQAKLRGLGHDAESVSTIMESALSAVRGTAYGLDSAATIAASAVAAGVKPGQQLAKYLGLTADAATIAGVSLDEMGSIFNKVTTGQRAYTQELNQLSDRGIPIYQWLQEELGISQKALRDMVAAGELDSATYFKVIEKNIGGAALESGKTTRGAWANMQAAMARVGAEIVKDIIPRIRDSFGSMTRWFDDNSDAIVSAVKTVIDVLGTFLGGIKSVLDFLIRIKPVTVGVVASLVAYKVAVIAINAAQMLWSALLVLTGTRVAILNGQVVMYRNAVTLATIAQAAWNAILSLNPIGLVIGAVVGLTAVLTVLTSGTHRMTAAEKWANETKKQSIEITRRLKEGEDNLKNARRDQEGASLRLERAQRTLNDALETYGAGSLEAREAALNLKQAEDDLNESNKKVKESTKELTEAQKDQRNMLRDINTELSTIDGRSVNYQINGEEMFARNYGGATGIIHSGTFSEGGFTGRGGKNQIAGTVHKGEFVIPKHLVDQSTGLPKQLVSKREIPSNDMASMVSSGIENNIGTINIATEADGEKWLRKLTKNQEITSAGLTPVQGWM